MAVFEYSEVKFLKGHSSATGKEKVKKKGNLEDNSKNRQVKITFFYYSWSEEQFEEKCLLLLEKFQERYPELLILDGCVDFSKNDEVILSFTIVASQKIVTSQIKALKQELTFLSRLTMGKNNEAEGQILEKDGLKQATKDAPETMVLLKQLLVDSKKNTNDIKSEMTSHSNFSKQQSQVLKTEIRKMINQAKIAEQSNVHLIEEGNQKLFFKLDELAFTVARLEQRLTNNHKMLSFLQERHENMSHSIAIIEEKIVKYFENEKDQNNLNRIQGITRNNQQLSNEATAITRTISELQNNLAKEKIVFSENGLANNEALTGGVFGFQNTLIRNEIKLSKQQQLAVKKQKNPLSKEHEACKKLFLNSISELHKNKKIKVSKEVFMESVNKTKFCEFNWSTIVNKFPMELFDLYELATYKNQMHAFSYFSEKLKPSEYNIPFVSKNILFVNTNIWERLQAYNLLNQYLEHIISINL